MFDQGRAAVAAVVVVGVSSAALGQGATPFTAIGLVDAPTLDVTPGDPDGDGPAVVVQPSFGAFPDVVLNPDVTASVQELLSFTTAFGTVGDLRGPISASGIVTDPAGDGIPAGDTVRNVWGFEGSEIDGGDSVLGLNVGAGLDNAAVNGTSFDLMFGDGVVGAAGEANDFFLMEIIGDDTVDVRPLDANGDAIGDFVLRIASGPGDANNFGNDDLGDWGFAGFDLSLVLESPENIGLEPGSIVDDIPLVGTAFDIEDFVGTGVLAEVWGLRITGIDDDPSVSTGAGSIDLIAAGYSVAAVPAPGAAGVLASAGLLGMRRRRITN